MSVALTLKRDEALHLIQELLQSLGPQVNVEINKADSVVTLKAQADHAELLQWAERIGDRYQDVFERLAK